MTIQRMTRQEAAKGVSQRWDAQYAHHNWTDKKEIGRQLRALTNPTPDIVDNIIGNGSWTRLTCDVCGNDKESIVEIDANEERGVQVCDDCLATVRP